MQEGFLEMKRRRLGSVLSGEHFCEFGKKLDSPKL